MEPETDFVESQGAQQHNTANRETRSLSFEFRSGFEYRFLDSAPALRILIVLCLIKSRDNDGGLIEDPWVSSRSLDQQVRQ